MILVAHGNPATSKILALGFDLNMSQSASSGPVAGRKRTARDAGFASSSSSKGEEDGSGNGEATSIAFRVDPLSIAYMHTDSLAAAGRKKKEGEEEDDKEKGATAKQVAAWDGANVKEKQDYINKTVRYCILQAQSGNGLIEEANVKKHVLLGSGTYHPRQLLTDAAILLHQAFRLYVSPNHGC
jgi:hypothetical protein